MNKDSFMGIIDTLQRADEQCQALKRMMALAESHQQISPEDFEDGDVEKLAMIVRDSMDSIRMQIDEACSILLREYSLTA